MAHEGLQVAIELFYLVCQPWSKLLDNCTSFSNFSFSPNFLTQALASGWVSAPSQTAHSRGQPTVAAINFTLPQHPMSSFLNKHIQAAGVFSPWTAVHEHLKYSRAVHEHLKYGHSHLCVEVKSQRGMPLSHPFLQFLGWLTNCWLANWPSCTEGKDTEERGKPLQISQWQI